MTINPLPPMPMKPLSRISASGYSTLKLCALRGIWAADHQPPLLPVSPAARLGTVVHKLLELASSGHLKNEESMLSCWQKEVQNQEAEMLINPLEKHLVPISNNVTNYRVKQLMAFNLTRPLINECAAQGKKEKTKSELWIETKDGKLGGRIDFIKHTDGGVCIIDYKTGEVLMDGNSIRQEYQDQLKMYAGLYYLSHNAWPAKLSLIGLDRSEYNLPFTQEECLNLIADAKKSLEDLNRLITAGLDATDLAVPSQESCRYCVYRPACKPYWTKRQDIDGWPADFIGAVRDKRILGNGLFKLVLGNSGKTVTIRGLSPERHFFLTNAVAEALFCNLSSDAVPGFFKENAMTTGYGLQFEEQAAQ